MSTAARRALEAAGCDALLASDPATVAWISGFAPDITSGPAVFAAPPHRAGARRRERAS